MTKEEESKRNISTNGIYWIHDYGATFYDALNTIHNITDSVYFHKIYLVETLLVLLNIAFGDLQVIIAKFARYLQTILFINERVSQLQRSSRTSNERRVYLRR